MNDKLKKEIRIYGTQKAPIGMLCFGQRSMPLETMSFFSSSMALTRVAKVLFVKNSMHTCVGQYFTNATKTFFFASIYPVSVSAKSM